jgi:hypothetical protein
VPRSKLITLLLAVAATSPIAGVAVWSIHRTAAELVDPCARWEDIANGQMITASIGPNDVCHGVTVPLDRRAGRQLWRLSCREECLRPHFLP